MDDEKDNGFDPDWTIAGAAAGMGFDPEEDWDRIPMKVRPLADYRTPKPVYKPMDWSNHEVTDRYDFVHIPADDPWPRFKVRHLPRRPGETDAQHAVNRRLAEEDHRCMGVYLGLAQHASTLCDHFRDCREGVCRRAGKCLSRRPEDDWTLLGGPMIPPCCDTEERVERVHGMIRDMVDEVMNQPADGPADGKADREG